MIQDENDQVFGSFTVEEWHHSLGFYGCGEDTFLYKFVHQKQEE